MAKFTPPDNPAIDAAVLARKQKDLEGYTARYQDILEARHVKYAKEIVPIWQRAEKRLDAQIKDLYKTYSDGQGRLSEDKLKTMQYGISRLEQLKGEISRVLGDTVGPLDTKLDNNLAYQYTNSYYYQAFALEQALEIQTIVPLVTENQVMGVLANPWLPDGATYSDRIRSSTTYLASKMYQAVGKAAVEGWGWNQTARTIQATAQEGYYNSVRLARTELNRAAAQGANNLYMQNADVLDGKRWNATLDSRTAAKDAKNDGKIYPLDYDTPENPGRAGERIPNHPNCRCSWTPYINYLGVSTRERIARGAGDSTEKFGERTYTKARTYEEYAKERGLPDLNERLANENPKRYLRPGEDLSAFGAAVGVLPAATAVIVPPVPETWADAVKSRIAQGVNTEADVREVGGLVRKRLTEQTDVLLAQQAALDNECESIIKQLNDTDPREYDGPMYAELQERYTKTRDKYYEVGIRIRGSRADRIRGVLKDLRPVGPKDANDLQPFISGSSVDVKAAVETVRSYLPADWVKASNTRPMKAKKSKRGYYQEAAFKDEAALRARGYTLEQLKAAGKIKYMEDTISLSGEAGDGMLRVAFHEMGHRMEDMIPGIKKLEKEFYARRTAGERLEWLGPGYKTSETTRKDNFLSPYMGKDYGNKETSFYELLSMGLESAYRGSYDLAKDDDYADFIYGILAAL